MFSLFLIVVCLSYCLSSLRRSKTAIQDIFKSNWFEYLNCLDGPMVNCHLLERSTLAPQLSNSGDHFAMHKGGSTPLWDFYRLTFAPAATSPPPQT